ncbi:MAG: DnaT-like ssDNA-binding protein [Planctomycetota bacterium]
MTALARSYLNVAELDALAPLWLTSIDERISVLNAASDADKAVALREATADIDALAYVGRRVDADQPLQFPRSDDAGNLIADGVELELPDGIAAWSVASIPADIRIATAIQACRVLMRGRAFDPARMQADQLAAGMTSMGGGGSTVTGDPHRAGRAWSRIDPNAQTYLRRLRRVGAEVV